MRNTTIQKVVHKINLRDQKSDFAYWQKQSPAARSAAGGSQARACLCQTGHASGAKRKY
ncbi:MAG: hypothetical protein Q7U68_01970 [Candidatus Roizmanbacteria bacterium]|nr:hypothetical protein [Candidatus Roizmanbacteria bacterium]